MPSRQPSQTPASRRERRAADRRRAQQAPRRVEQRRGWLQSPALIATAAAVVVALGFVAFLLLQNPGGSNPGTIQEPISTTPPALAHGRTLGSDSAPVKLEVYSDFQCPACLQFWTTIEPKVVADEVATGKAQLLYRDYTFIGPESLDAAVAARCADQQGKFWTYHDILYANQGRENSGAFSATRLTAMAQAVGLDMSTWTTCRSDASVSAAVQQETAAAQARGVIGTPTLFVNGAKLASYDLGTVDGAITAALGSSTPAPAASSPAPAAATSAGSAASSAGSAASP
jgi:protein-disulfide isomerase